MRKTFSLHNGNKIKINSHLNDILFTIEQKKKKNRNKFCQIF